MASRGPFCRRFGERNRGARGARRAAVSALDRGAHEALHDRVAAAGKATDLVHEQGSFVAVLGELQERVHETRHGVPRHPAELLVELEKARPAAMGGVEVRLVDQDRHRYAPSSRSEAAYASTWCRRQCITESIATWLGPKRARSAASRSGKT